MRILAFFWMSARDNGMSGGGFSNSLISASVIFLLRPAFFSSFFSFLLSFSSFFARSNAACDSAFVMLSICFFSNFRSLNL